jgi:hypothetical protein
MRRSLHGTAGSPPGRWMRSRRLILHRQPGEPPLRSAAVRPEGRQRPGIRRVQRRIHAFSRKIGHHFPHAFWRIGKRRGGSPHLSVAICAARICSGKPPTPRYRTASASGSDSLYTPHCKSSAHVGRTTYGARPEARLGWNSGAAAGDSRQEVSRTTHGILRSPARLLLNCLYGQDRCGTRY